MAGSSPLEIGEEACSFYSENVFEPIAGFLPSERMLVTETIVKDTCAVGQPSDGETYYLLVQTIEKNANAEPMRFKDAGTRVEEAKHGRHPQGNTRVHQEGDQEGGVACCGGG